MNRRQVLACAAALLAAPAARSQGRVRRIGFLALSDPSTNPLALPLMRALEEGLRELGYVEGQNLVIERRHAGGLLARVPEVAAELARLKVEVIVTVGAQNVRAVQRALPAMPIVTLLGDPIGGGFAKSLARPGGSVTGVTNIGADVSIQQLELLRAALPGLKRVAVLGNSSNPFTKSIEGSLQAGAARLGLSVTQFDAPSADALEGAISAMAQQKPGAVVVVQDIFLVQHSKRIAGLLLEHRLASTGGAAEQAALGLLMSYGANQREAFRRMASYVDRILKGARPGELPIEILEHYELTLNLKTARALGLAIPKDVLLRADRVIE